MYEIIANLLKESKKTTVITGDGISIDSQKIDYKTIGQSVVSVI